MPVHPYILVEGLKLIPDGFPETVLSEYEIASDAHCAGAIVTGST